MPSFFSPFLFSPGTQKGRLAPKHPSCNQNKNHWRMTQNQRHSWKTLLSSCISPAGSSLWTRLFINTKGHYSYLMSSALNYMSCNYLVYIYKWIILHIFLLNNLILFLHSNLSFLLFTKRIKFIYICNHNSYSYALGWKM